MKLLAILIWTAAIGMLSYTAYGAVFGTSTFGADVFGTGTTTTSVYTPGMKEHIIGGGLVKLTPDDNKSNHWNTNVNFTIEYSKNLIWKENRI